MQAVIGVRARRRILAAVAAAAVILSSAIATPAAHAAGEISPPEGLAFEGTPRVGETLEIPSHGWQPSSPILTVDWFVDDDLVIDESEAETPLDLTLRAEWLGKTVSAEITAEAVGYDTLVVELVAETPVLEGQWVLPTPTLSSRVLVDRPVRAEVSGAPADAQFSYLWLLDGATLPGATTDSYTPKPSQIGRELSVRVTGKRVGYVDSQAFSARSVIAELLDFPSVPTPSLDPVVVANEPVAVDVGTWPQGTSLAYRFNVDGDVVGETSEVGGFAFPSSAIGKAVSVTVVAANDDYRPIAVTSDIRILHGAFSARPAPTLSGLVAVGSQATVSPGTWEPTANLTYGWYVNGVLRGSGVSYTPAAADAGLPLVVKVTAMRPDYQTATATSAPVVVAQGSFSTTPAPTFSGAARVGSPLTAAPGTWTPGATLAYAWKVGGTVVSTASSYTPVSGDLGKSITVSVTATRTGFLAVTKTSAPAAIGYGVFTTKPKPAIAGTVRVGTALTATVGTWAPTATFTYAWKVAGKTVSTSKTFTPAVAQRGQKLTLTVTAARAGFTSIAQTTASATIGYGAFATAPAPKVSGTTKVGSTLKATAGTWSPTATLSYQWLRNDAAIKGATKTSYKLTASDWKKKVTVKVTAKRTGYSTTTRTSVASAAVTKPFSKTTTPTISGTTRVGSTLTAGVSAWSPKASFTYQWKRNGAAIAGATSKTYKLAAVDYGKTLTVTVSGRYTGYVAKATTSKATAKISGPAATITKAGTYRVGSQLSPGTYTANAKAGCYWERRSKAGTSFGGIIANDFVGYAGRAIVTISSSDKYFYTDSDCGSWTRMARLGSPASSFGNGTHAVGIHVRPGTYAVSSATDSCYWEVVTGFGGSFDEIDENHLGDLGEYMVVELWDGAGFSTRGCGTWKRIGD